MRPIRIVIFAKAPLPGYAKTRLIPQLGLDGSARLACKLLQHAIEQALAANLGQVELCVSPSEHHPVWKQLDLPSELSWSYQSEGDLGERMARAIKRVTQNGESILLMGTDCPDLDAETLRAASKALASHDACLVPVLDGGYSLVGLHHPLEAIFRDMPWSTEQVGQLTRQRIAAAGKTLAELEILYDIDVPADLNHLPDHWFE
ncbi:MAG: hypothetical protein CMI09_04755 [Oceanospirillaceae bacterium]|nr:hypothetical protein [Oceanospirillaceae bacterium]